MEAIQHITWSSCFGLDYRRERKEYLLFFVLHEPIPDALGLLAPLYPWQLGNINVALVDPIKGAVSLTRLPLQCTSNDWRESSRT